MFALPPKKDISECIVCNKPLGADTKALGYPVCHEHRLCSKCNEPLAPAEAKWCHQEYLELKDAGNETASLQIIHPRCSVLTRPTIEQDPTLSIKQSEYEYLNLLRLMIEPSPDLSLVTNENNAMIQSHKLIHNWDFDKCYAHLKMLEACVANVSIALSQNKKELQKRAEERDGKRKKQADLEARTSSRPAQKPADDEHEILLAAFMEKNSIKSRSVGQKIWRDRCKAIEGFVKCGMSETIAQDMVDKGIDYTRKAKEMGDK